MNKRSSDLRVFQDALLWLAPARAGYAKPTDWIAWADRRIAESDNVESWLVDLSLANDVDSLEKLLALQMRRERLHSDESNDEDVVLGYLWERYQRGDIELQECLDSAGHLADTYDTEIDCEVYFALLSRLRSTSHNVEQCKRIEQEACCLFAQSHKNAMRQWQLLSA